MSLLQATDEAVRAAGHLTAMDAGAVEAMRALARKIDAWDRIVQWAEEDAEDHDRRPSVPQNDNVSLSAYLKYCDQLGLTPAGRKAAAAPGSEKPAEKASPLDELNKRRAARRAASKG